MAYKFYCGPVDYINYPNCWSDTRTPLQPGANQPSIGDDVFIIVLDPMHPGVNLSLVGFYGLWENLECDNIYFETPTTITGPGSILIHKGMGWLGSNDDSGHTGGYVFYDPSYYINFLGVDITGFVRVTNIYNSGMFTVAGLNNVGKIIVDNDTSATFVSPLTCTVGYGDTGINFLPGSNVAFNFQPLVANSNYVYMAGTITNVESVTINGEANGSVQIDSNVLNLPALNLKGNKYLMIGSGNTLTVGTLTMENNKRLTIDENSTLVIDEFVGTGIYLDTTPPAYYLWPQGVHYVYKTTGTVDVFNWHIKDSYAYGGADFSAYDSEDLGGNTGWFIYPTIPGIVYTYDHGSSTWILSEVKTYDTISSTWLTSEIKTYANTSWI